MRNSFNFKIFLTIVISTYFIFGLSQAGANTFTALMDQGKFPEGTTVSGLDLSGLSEDEAKTALQQKVEDWKSNSTILLKVDGKAIELKPTIFQLGVDETITNLQLGRSATTVITINEQQLTEELQPLIEEVDLDIDKSLLKEELLSLPILTETGEFSLDLTSFGVDQQEESTVIVSTVTVPLSDTLKPSVAQSVEGLGTLTVVPNESFSFLTNIQDQSIGDDNQAINVLATGIYEAILSTNFEIQERNISMELPSYSQPGFEAKVDVGRYDLSFLNPNEEKYYINLEMNAEGLVVNVTGKPFENEVVVRTTDEMEVKPRTIIQYSPKLAVGQVVVKEEGKAGLNIKVYREAKGSNGEIIESTLISDDYYPPTHTVKEQWIPSEAETEYK